MMRESPIANTIAEVETEMAAIGRRAAKAAAQTVLPPSLLVWRGPKQHTSKRVALTFDDGPTEMTEPYLDILDEFDARATFFLIGAWCARYRQLVEEIAHRGHELAGHGYTHRTFTSLSRSELEAEIERTEALLPETTRLHRYVRPPKGQVSVCSLMTCANMGFTTILWSRDSEDWCTRDPDRIVEAVERDPLDPGEILLFHEGQQWTVDALPRILGRLSDDGYDLVTVSELLDRR